MTHALYVFDAYGTLFDVHSAAERAVARIEPRWREISEVWRQKQLEYTWVESLAGGPPGGAGGQTGGRPLPDFWELTGRALDVALATYKIAPDLIRPLMLEAYRTLAAYPEVKEVLTALKARGARTAILSNGTAGMLRTAVSAAGIGPLLDAILSVDSVGIYKPDARVYNLVGETFDAAPEEVSFQSSNAWDAAGASGYGFRTVWVNRAGKPREYPDRPVTEVSDLRALLA